MGDVVVMKRHPEITLFAPVDGFSFGVGVGGMIWWVCYVLDRFCVCQFLVYGLCCS